jgi:uncharacterized protein (DUF1810 family)
MTGSSELSSMSTSYAIRSLAEASAYLEHLVLGARLGECTRIVGESGDGPREGEHDGDRDIADASGAHAP